MYWLRKGLQSPIGVSLGTSIFVALTIIALHATGNLQPLELKAYDWQLGLRGATEKDQPPILIVAATEDDIRTLGWPLTDAKLAEILKKLVQYKARAIGLDIYRDLEVAPGRDKLDPVLSTNTNIIAATKFPEKNRREVPPPPILRGTGRIGVNDVIVDSDGIVRRGLIYLDDGKSPDSIIYSLAVKLALLYLGKERLEFDSNESATLVWGKAAIKAFETNDGGYVGADAAGYQFLLDFRDSPLAFSAISVSDLLHDKLTRQLVEDKIILVGVTAQSVPDLFHIPGAAPKNSGNTIHGVGLHASIVAQLLRLAGGKTQPITTTSEQEEWLLILLGALASGALGLRVRSPWRYCSLLAAAISLFVLLSQIALTRSFWIPVVPTLFSTGGSALLIAVYMSNQEKLQRSLLMQIFSRHVSPEVAETVWSQREAFLDGGRLRPQLLTVTVLFTDLVNFTAVSETKQPDELLSWLNDYMEQMSRLVVDHGGVINKYIGDSVMAIFGVPIPRTNENEIRQDAINSVKCALQMGHALTELNQLWKTQGLPMVGMRVGIYTGPVVVGSLGGSGRLEYTIIGDTVNTASRLEGYGKEKFVPDFLKGPCRIIVGETTYRYLDNEFNTERVGEASLKGKDEKIVVYSVLATPKNSCQTAEERT
jgi:adenylate cyclase